MKEVVLLTGAGQIGMAIARRLKVGDVVNIPANVKHWHGATKDGWFQHIAQEIPGTETSTEWREEVTDDEYSKAD